MSSVYLSMVSLITRKSKFINGTIADAYQGLGLLDTHFLRTKLTKALSTRTVPELHFEIDRGLEHAARINALLADIKHEDPA